MSQEAARKKAVAEQRAAKKREREEAAVGSKSAKTAKTSRSTRSGSKSTSGTDDVIHIDEEGHDDPMIRRLPAAAATLVHPPAERLVPPCAATQTTMIMAVALMCTEARKCRWSGRTAVAGGAAAGRQAEESAVVGLLLGCFRVAVGLLWGRADAGCGRVA